MSRVLRFPGSGAGTHAPSPSVDRALADGPAASVEEHARFFVELNRRCSGARRTFYMRTLREYRLLGSSHDFYCPPVERWTDETFNDVVNRLAAHLPVQGGQLSIEVKRQPAYNWRHRRSDPSTGPRTCHYLSLCVRSGKWRMQLGLGRDVCLAGSWAGSKLAELPDTDDTRIDHPSVSAPRTAVSGFRASCQTGSKPSSIELKARTLRTADPAAASIIEQLIDGQLRRAGFSPAPSDRAAHTPR